MYAHTMLIRHAVALVTPTDPHREAMSASNAVVQRLNSIQKGKKKHRDEFSTLWRTKSENGLPREQNQCIDMKVMLTCKGKWQG